MQQKIYSLLGVILLTVCSPVVRAQEIYQYPKGVQTRWISPENPSGAKGQAGMENQGAKGHPFETIRPGESLVLASIEGTGIIHRMWITISDRSPIMLRALRLEMYWDGADRPAVSVPFGDFFGPGLGRTAAFENALFSSPEGRSFNTLVPMPFQRSARIVLTNESGKDLDRVFYDIDYTLQDSLPENTLYFHAYWHRNPATTLGEDFEILPRITGQGRLLGTHVGVLTDSTYENTWWGEGEIRIYLDGDDAYPTLSGTGTEDYIGTGWGQGAYVNRFQGATIANPATREWTFYRYHIPDPVVFSRDCRVTLQQMGGTTKADVIKMIELGTQLQPVTIDAGNRERFVKLLEQSPVPELTDPDLPDGWTNFYRSDDVSATAFFYLDRPYTPLPPLQSVQVRIDKLSQE